MDKPTHPPTSKMVYTALQDLHDRRGTPFVAIKKYIFSSYGVDPAPLMRHMRRYLENAVTEGTVIRTKGVGMAASFKLAPQKPSSKKKPASDQKPSSEKKPASDQQPSSDGKPVVKKKPLDTQKHDLKSTTTATKTATTESTSEKLAEETKKKKAADTITKKPATKKVTKVTKVVGTLNSGTLTPASMAAISKAKGRKISFTAKKIKH